MIADGKKHSLWTTTGVEGQREKRLATVPCIINSSVIMNGSDLSQPNTSSAEETDPRTLRTVKRRREHQVLVDDDGNNNDDSSSVHSVESTRQAHGKWGDDLVSVPWNGCVCGQVHARPIPVYWILCEGPCSAWFNVSPRCVKGMTAEKAQQTLWNCRKCTRLLEKQAALQTLLQLPHDVLYRILQFTAIQTHRAAVLCHKLAPLNKLAWHFVQGDKSRALWQAILRQEYSAEKQKNTSYPDPRRASTRRRKRTSFWAPCPNNHGSNHPRHWVQQEHALLLTRIEDVYYHVEELADPSNNGTRQKRLSTDSTKNKKRQSLTLYK
jgi:hypothetical protein